MSKTKNLKAFWHWKACIFSGSFIRIEHVEGVPVSMGYCNRLKRWVDFEIECPDCKKRRTERRPPKHERTPTRKARIGTARRRSIARRKERFNASMGIKKV